MPSERAQIVYACNSGFWMAGTGETRRPDGTRRVESYASGGDGSAAHPWTGWETAFASLPADGGRIEFAKGFYVQRTEVRLPVALRDWLFVVGNGATIKLTAEAPRFLDPDLSADHQLVTKIWIEGFEIDAGGVGGHDHAIFGNYVGKNGVGGFRRVNWDRIVVKDVRAFNLTVDPKTVTHRGGIYIVSVHAGNAEPVRDSITNIYVENVRVEGGNWGILIDGNSPAGADSTNIDIDNVWLVGCWHSTLARHSASFPSSNFQIGEHARVGRVHVIDCYGQFSGDTGLELNSTAFAHVLRTTIEDSAVADFYYTNFNTPPREPQVVWEGCRATISGDPHPKNGFGWRIINSYGAVAAGGRFRIVDSGFARSGTTESAAAGAGVSTAGRIAELSVEASEFDLSGGELAGLDFSPRVLEVNFASDLTFRLHHVKIRTSATRASGSSGLSAIVTQAAVGGKTLTLDWDDVDVSTEVTGAPVDGSVATAILGSSVPNTLRGTISRYRIAEVGGDAKASGIAIDLAKQTVDGNLLLDEVDARNLPSLGSAVRFDHAGLSGEQSKITLKRVRLPTKPETSPVNSPASN